MELDYIEPGIAIQNCLAEIFNGMFRGECLNENLFTSVGEAIRKVRASWRRATKRNDLTAHWVS